MKSWAWWCTTVIQLHGKCKQEDLSLSQARLYKSEALFKKIATAKSGNVAQEVECLPSPEFKHQYHQKQKKDKGSEISQMAKHGSSWRAVCLERAWKL
jgi:hypothetical protein